MLETGGDMAGVRKYPLIMMTILVNVDDSQNGMFMYVDMTMTVNHNPLKGL